VRVGVAGEIVTTGRTLDREAAASHALEVQCSDGELSTPVRVLVRVLDLNDHAPAFTQHFYDIRVPVTADAHLDLPQVSLFGLLTRVDWSCFLVLCIVSIAFGFQNYAGSW
jgi:hypothetical protein